MLTGACQHGLAAGDQTRGTRSSGHHHWHALARTRRLVSTSGAHAHVHAPGLLPARAVHMHTYMHRARCQHE
eukprot:1790976-Alexandrium_andersonii.AAC.1